jgi:hypothetical protein
MTHELTNPVSAVPAEVSSQGYLRKLKQKTGVPLEAPHRVTYAANPLVVDIKTEASRARHYTVCAREIYLS